MYSLRRMAVTAHAAQSLTGTRLPSERVAELQRAKILAAAVHVLDEYGHAATTVARITSGARVSRSSFYELFGDRDECLAAILDHAAVTIEGELAARAAVELPWSERVRGGLLSILRLLDREPALARVCVVEALRCGSVVLERRTLLLARLAAALDQGRGEHVRGANRTELTAGALVGAVFWIVHTRILRGCPESLEGLMPDLMPMLLLPYEGDGVLERPRARTLRSPRLTEGLRAERRPALSSHAASL